MSSGSTRKASIRRFFDELAASRSQWIERNRYFYEEDRRFMQFLVPTGQRVLELGCGNGQLMAALRPSFGVGVDISEKMIADAKREFPGFEYVVGDAEDRELIESLPGPFDVIIVSDTIGLFEDCESTIENLHRLCSRDTRLIISYYTQGWDPILKVATYLRLKMPQLEQNALATGDIVSLLELADFMTIKREWRVLIPRRLLGIGRFINRFLAPLPLIRRLCIRSYIVAAPNRGREIENVSATVLVPCKNERGNVESAVTRTPSFCEDLEILFVEGGSSDDTRGEIDRVIRAYPEKKIRVIEQNGKGKGNAVREGFDAAKGDILMILDGDLTVPPESLPRFYRALTRGKGDFINGTRLVYPMQDQAMRFLNLLANHTFSRLFTWLLNQRYTDTLCGTKVLTKHHYEQIAANRSYFGDFDPFGDFDLIFGAAKLNLKTVEIPVRYAARQYGETQISRFRHGWLLLKMVIFAYRKLKAL